MTELELLNILNRRESESLDFKSQPYQIVGNSGGNDDKAKLVKDVLAMANAWRDGPAHILLGIDESAEGAPIVVGISPDDPFDDACLQSQFTDRINRPLRLWYERITVHGKPVGVITLAHPVERPFFLKQNLGKLRAGAVFVRRGSTNVEADPDEIARMGRAASRTRLPRLVLEFADPVTGRVFGSTVTCTVTSVQWPLAGTAEYARIQRLLRDEQTSLLPLLGARKKLDQQYNELYESHARCRVGFGVKNDGDGPASDVHVGFKFPRDLVLSIAEVQVAVERHSAAGSVSRPGFEVVHRASESVVSLRVPKVQAGARWMCDQMLSFRLTAEVVQSIRASITADQLPAPQISELTLCSRTKLAWFNP
jgi:hypothetical protein